MVKEDSIKIFLSNGITITVKGSEKIYDKKCNEIEFVDLYKYIASCYSKKEDIVFSVDITNTYKDEDKKEATQEITHEYYIPCEKITWFMKESI